MGQRKVMTDFMRPSVLAFTQAAVIECNAGIGYVVTTGAGSSSDDVAIDDAGRLVLLHEPYACQNVFVIRPFIRGNGAYAVVEVKANPRRLKIFVELAERIEDGRSGVTAMGGRVARVDQIEL